MHIDLQRSLDTASHCTASSQVLEQVLEASILPGVTMEVWGAVDCGEVWGVTGEEQ